MADNLRNALANLRLGSEDGDLTIGIDFGTAYSSVSWIKGISLHIKDIRDIGDWPSAHYMGPYSTAGEVPSEWMYCNGAKRFGYEVHHMLTIPGHEQWYRLSNIKMLLDNSKNSMRLRRQGEETLKKINATLEHHEKKITVSDVIVDYLLFLLGHTKAQLSKKNVRGKSEYMPGDPIKFVLSIPESWDPVARWTMECALALVTKKLEFGSTQDLFMISESESASTYMLEKLRKVFSPKSESIVTADSGGGTTDVATFEVTNDFPLRLKPVGTSEARSVGSSLLDFAFGEYLADRVKDQTHLNAVSDGHTLVESIDEGCLHFHRQMKRRDLEMNPEYVLFNGLKNCPEKGFARGSVIVPQIDIARIFDPVCDEVWEMIEGQIRAALAEGHNPSSVLCVGGLGLSEYLQKKVETKLASRYPEIKLLPTRELMMMDATYSAVVSRGAVFRFPGHRGGETYVDEVDGNTYVNDCLYYLYKPNQEVGPDGALEKHSMWEILRPGQNFDVRIPVYMKSGKCVDHYHIGHPKNAGAQKLGDCELVFKTTFQEIQKHSTDSSFMKKEGYYLIKYEVIIRMDGLRMEYEMRYPPDGTLHTKGNLENIAAAFDLGSA